MKVAKHIKHVILGISAAVCTSSCIKNDIPYPFIDGVIQSIEVNDIQGEAKIDNQRKLVEITVGEEAILNEMTITKLVANPESRILPDPKSCYNSQQFPDYSFTSLNDLPANANTMVYLDNPMLLVLRTYNDYIWTIKVTQKIDRTIEIDHQVGEPQFDVQNRRAIVYIEGEQPLDNIHINRINLEGSSATIQPDPTTVTDFTRPQAFKVYKKNKLVATWTVDVQPTDATSTTGKVEAWGTKAILNGGMKSGATPIVEYKKTSESLWKTVDASLVQLLSNTAFKVELKGLDGGTEYQWRITVNEVTGDPATFQTERIVEIPNLSLDTWTQSENGKNWYPNPVANNYDDPQAYWASGNEGITSVGKEATTVPVSGTSAYKGKAAKMTSLTGVPLVGAAAGNLYIGTYKTNLSSPRNSTVFGRPYTGARPTKIRGYYKYLPMPITHQGTNGVSITKDQCHVYFMMWDSSGKQFAYGEFIVKEEVSEYKPFEVVVDYEDLEAKPARMALVATSSRYGGDFEGMKVCGPVGHGSTLWVDELEFIYE